MAKTLNVIAMDTITKLVSESSLAPQLINIIFNFLHRLNSKIGRMQARLNSNSRIHLYMLGFLLAEIKERHAECLCLATSLPTIQIVNNGPQNPATHHAPDVTTPNAHECRQDLEFVDIRKDNGQLALSNGYYTISNTT
jgi:hypothetical protein